MGDPDREPALRALSRQQWVREHGTPRLTTLVGDPVASAMIWREWLRGVAAEARGTRAFEAPPDADESWLTRVATEAHAAAVADPRRPIAIVVGAGLLRAWLASRDDRLAAFVAEGVIEITTRAPAASPGSAHAAHAAHAAPAAPVAPAPRAVAPIAPRPRSSAEAVMLAALEATPATRGRFQLNQSLSFPFGERAAEVDLLSRADEIAIEIDGYHHFTDPEHYRRDRRKDLLLQAHGYVVLRFLADDVLTDARTAVDAVVELLGVRRGRARRVRES
ncbi:MAG TPA: DUF559 domain-containing protein [Kofleriaceae bacterium]|nr:DUF559 domain-containing protein [Kofleriaceae bacterium]